MKLVYADKYGLSAVAKIGPLRRAKRFPHDADPAVIQQWQADTRAQLLGDYETHRAQRADARSLTRSIAVYLRRRKGRPGYEADRSHLKAWIPALGSKRRHQISREDIEKVIAGWLSQTKPRPVQPRTIRHRVRALRELYRALDGRRVHHPLTDVRLPKVPKVAPIPVAAAVIQKVAKSLKKGLRHEEGYGADPVKSRARFLVYATTGQRPAQIGRALPGDVDLERGIWWVRPAKGGTPIAFPLNDDAREAWTIFAKAKAWGMFDTTSLAKLLRRHGWPKGIRPYQLRHTFAIDLLLAGTDLGDVQGLLGHASVTTTRDFYAPVLLSRLQSAVAKRQLDLNPKAPNGRLRTRVRRTGQNRPKSSTFRQSRRTRKKGVSRKKRP